MMKQMVVTYDTEVLHTIKSFSNANNHELFSCAPPPFSEILGPPVHGPLYRSYGWCQCPQAMLGLVLLL